MAFKRNCKLREISKSKIRDTRNIVVNEMIGFDGSNKGYLVVQQLELREEDEVTRMFMKGGIRVSNLSGLKNFRDALNKAIDKVERRNKTNKWNKNEVKEESSKYEEQVFDDPENEPVCESCKVHYPDEMENIEPFGESNESWDEEQESDNNVDEIENEEWDDVENMEESESDDEYEDEEEDNEEEILEESERVESDYDLGEEEEWES